MSFGVGVSYRILYSIVSYLYVSCSGSIISVGEGRTFVCLYYVASVRRGFLFLWVLGMGCVILLWHSLSIPYNHGLKTIAFSVVGVVNKTFDLSQYRKMHQM